MAEASRLRRFARTVNRWSWNAYGRFGFRVGAGVDAHATVLITYYHPARLRHLNGQVRNVLRCRFVDRLVLSNHNPATRLEDALTVRDPRIVIVQQDVSRGCGYRWKVARDHVADFMVVIDDDLLLYPWQLAGLFEHVVRDPSRPHGLAGMVYGPAGDMRYVQDEECAVDYLCELYAVTGSQVLRYETLREQLSPRTEVTDSIDRAADFVLISRTGQGSPSIHRAGRVFRDESFDQAGVAVHQGPSFGSSLGAVRAAVESLPRA